MKWNITKCRLIRLSHSNTNNDVSSVWGSQGLEVVLNSAIEEHGWWRLLSTLTSHFEANTQETVLGVICESALQFMKYPDDDADSLYFVVRKHTFKPFPTVSWGAFRITYFYFLLVVRAAAAALKKYTQLHAVCIQSGHLTSWQWALNFAARKCGAQRT